ncbi:MAG: hypothetical protein ACE5DS_06455, partial [Kiloniellaceae bacterium]
MTIRGRLPGPMGRVLRALAAMAALGFAAFAPGGAGARAAPAVVLAAGDIAHCGETGPMETAALL